MKIRVNREAGRKGKLKVLVTSMEGPQKFEFQK